MVFAGGVAGLADGHTKGGGVQRHLGNECGTPASVTARKDDAPAAVQAAGANVAVSDLISGGGGLIQTTSG
jgi:hypothetical protein